MIIFKSKNNGYKYQSGLRLIKVIFLSGIRLGFEITFRHGYVKVVGVTGVYLVSKDTLGNQS